MRPFSHFRSYTRSMLALLLLAVLLLTSCGGDDAPTQPNPYGLRIRNLTPRDLNVWQKPSAAGDVFQRVGVSTSGATYRVNPLTPGTEYLFRLVRDGNSIDAFDFERTVQSPGGDVDWEVK